MAPRTGRPGLEPRVVLLSETPATPPPRAPGLPMSPKDAGTTPTVIHDTRWMTPAACYRTLSPRPTRPISTSSVPRTMKAALHMTCCDPSERCRMLGRRRSNSCCARSDGPRTRSNTPLLRDTASIAPPARRLINDPITASPAGQMPRQLPAPVAGHAALPPTPTPTSVPVPPNP